MSKNRVGVILKVVCFLVGSAVCVSNASPLLVIAEDSVLQHRKGNTVTGPAAELMKALLAEAQLTGEFKIVPWSRAYNTALSRPDTIIYSIAKTPERADLFTWIGEVIPLRYQFYRLKSSTHVNPANLEQSKAFTIGAISRGAIHQFLRREKFPKVVAVASPTSHIRMFMNNRYDLIVIDSSSLNKVCMTTELDCSLIEAVLPIPKISNSLYIALNNSSSPQIAQQLKEAYNELKNNGQYKRIMGPTLEK
ncbi:MAG: substrate-binding periplasmic protein [Psychrobium sp.]